MNAWIGILIVGLLVFTGAMASFTVANGMPMVKTYSVKAALAGHALRTFSSAQVINPKTFTWPTSIVNKKTIARLIECESGWANVSAVDSDGIPSDGILQFHENGTWQAMSKLSGITGSPMNPADAIRMGDWMISHGYIGRWTCARILGLS